MAALSSKFASISPGMDTDTAQEGLVSIMKAFNVSEDEVETEIMDKINVLGKIIAQTYGNIWGYKSQQITISVKVQRWIRPRKDIIFIITEDNVIINKKHIGEKIGHLMIEDMIRKPTPSGNKTFCICQCDCGNPQKVIRQYDNIKRSNMSSCGCARKGIIQNNIVGNIYGKLQILEEYADISPRKVKCKCECGNITILSKSDVIEGHTKSCGCLKRINISLSNTKDWTNYISDYGVKAIKQEYKNSKGQWMWSYECPLCHKIFTALPARINNGHITSCGCRKQSANEDLIENLLKEYNIKYLKQYSFEDCKYKDKLRYDFALLNNNDEVFYLIEYDGQQHFYPIDWFGGQKQYDESIKRDEIKNQYCKLNNIPLLRLPYTLKANEIKERIINIMNP